MNDRIINQLSMINTCVATAQSPEYRPLWDGKSPEDFAADLAQLDADLVQTRQIASDLGLQPEGIADAKDLAESALEDIGFTIATALRTHYRKSGNTERMQRFNYTRSHLVRMRDETLLAEGRALLAAAQSAVAEPDASKRGLTQERVDALNRAVDQFAKLLPGPRTGIVNRGALLRELDTRVAGHMEDLENLDDLILLLEPSDLTTRFQIAWRSARAIVNSGRGPRPEPDAPAATTTAGATPAATAAVAAAT